MNCSHMGENRIKKMRPSSTYWKFLKVYILWHKLVDCLQTWPQFSASSCIHVSGKVTLQLLPSTAESISPLLESGLPLWLVVADRLYQKWWWTNFKSCTLCSFGILSSHHMTSWGCPVWGWDHVEHKQAVLADGILGKPGPPSNR